MALPYIGVNLIENMMERQRYLPDDPFDLSDNKFVVKLFRLRKLDVENLEEMLEPYLPVNNRIHAISNRTKILCTLHIFAGGGYQLDVGRNHSITISQPSVSKCLHEVLDAMNHPNILNRSIHFPNTIEGLINLRERVFRTYRLPGLIGCIDCTHIAIVSPVENEHVFVNRKNFHSLNVQMICDENLKITNAFARYPGSTHDSFIWQNSNVEQFLRTLPEDQMGSFYLLGDSGYPLRPWLVTPILPEPAPETAEFRFNRRIRQIRVKIEQCFGLLKNRFRCLLKDRVLHYAPETAAKITNSCVILHNLCIDNNIPMLLEEPYVNEDRVEDNDIVNFVNDIGNQNGNNYLARGRQLRNLILRNYF